MIFCFCWLISNVTVGYLLMSFKYLTQQWLLNLLPVRFETNLIKLVSRGAHVESNMEADCGGNKHNISVYYRLVQHPHDMNVAVRLLLRLLRARHHRASLLELTVLPECLVSDSPGVFLKTSGIDFSSPGVTSALLFYPIDSRSLPSRWRTASRLCAACQADHWTCLNNKVHLLTYKQ